jgi:hypothetical protein
MLVILAIDIKTAEKGSSIGHHAMKTIIVGTSVTSETGGKRGSTGLVTITIGNVSVIGRDRDRKIIGIIEERTTTDKIVVWSAIGRMSMVIREKREATNLLTTSIALATDQGSTGQGRDRRQRGSFVGGISNANG